MIWPAVCRGSSDLWALSEGEGAISGMGFSSRAEYDWSAGKGHSPSGGSRRTLSCAPPTGMSLGCGGRWRRYEASHLGCITSPRGAAVLPLAGPDGESSARSLHSAGAGILVTEETDRRSGVSNRRGFPVLRCHHSDGTASLEDSACRRVELATGMGLPFAGGSPHSIEPRPDQTQ